MLLVRSYTGAWTHWENEGDGGITSTKHPEGGNAPLQKPISIKEKIIPYYYYHSNVLPTYRGLRLIGSLSLACQWQTLAN